MEHFTYLSSSPSTSSTRIESVLNNKSIIKKTPSVDTKMFKIDSNVLKDKEEMLSIKQRHPFRSNKVCNKGNQLTKPFQRYDDDDWCKPNYLGNDYINKCFLNEPTSFCNKYSYLNSIEHTNSALVNQYTTNFTNLGNSKFKSRVNLKTLGEQLKLLQLIIIKFSANENFILKKQRLKLKGLNIQVFLEAFADLTFFFYLNFFIKILESNSKIFDLATMVLFIAQIFLRFYGLTVKFKQQNGSTKETIDYAQKTICENLNSSNLPLSLKKSIILSKIGRNIYFCLSLISSYKLLFTFQIKNITHILSFALFTILTYDTVFIFLKYFLKKNLIKHRMNKKDKEKQKTVESIC